MKISKNCLFSLFVLTLISLFASVIHAMPTNTIDSKESYNEIYLKIEQRSEKNTCIHCGSTIDPGESENVYYKKVDVPLCCCIPHEVNQLCCLENGTIRLVHKSCKKAFLNQLKTKRTDVYCYALSTSLITIMLTAGITCVAYMIYAFYEDLHAQ